MDALDALLAQAMTGDRRSLARLLTVLDGGGEPARRAAEAVAVRAGRTLVVGITGVPGGGKSTLVNALLGSWLAQGKKLAVVAVDPSSPVTGGAVLGDRARLSEHSNHPNVFIRSLSTHGQKGGLSTSTRAVVNCFDVAGFDRVIVETVGAGQSETDIAELADICVVVCPPGLGDGIQAMKAGILEIADVLVVSKSDLPQASVTATEMREMFSLRSASVGKQFAQIIEVSAQTSVGLESLVEAIDRHAEVCGSGRRPSRVIGTGTNA